MRAGTGDPAGLGFQRKAQRRRFTGPGGVGGLVGGGVRGEVVVFLILHDISSFDRVLFFFFFFFFLEELSR